MLSSAHVSNSNVSKLGGNKMANSFSTMISFISTWEPNPRVGLTPHQVLMRITQLRAVRFLGTEPVIFWHMLSVLLRATDLMCKSALRHSLPISDQRQQIYFLQLLSLTKRALRQDAAQSEADSCTYILARHLRISFIRSQYFLLQLLDNCLSYALIIPLSQMWYHLPAIDSKCPC